MTRATNGSVILATTPLGIVSAVTVAWQRPSPAGSAMQAAAVAIALGALFRDETIAAISLLGTLLVTAGAYLTSRGDRERSGGIRPTSRGDPAMGTDRPMPPVDAAVRRTPIGDSSP